MGTVEVGDALVGAVVVGVGEDVGEVAGVVGGLGKGVGNAEAEAGGEAAFDANLEAVVHGRSGVFGDADDAHAEIGAEGIDVDARVGEDGARLELVDVAFALVMNAAAADVADFHGEIPGELASEGGVPVPGHGDFEDRVLDGHGEGEDAGGGAAGGVDVAVRDGLLELEGGVAAEGGIAIDHGAIGEGAEAGAEAGLVIETVRCAEARLEDAPVGFGEAVGEAAVAALEVRQIGEAFEGFGTGAVAGEDDAVVGVAAGDEAAGTIDGDGALGIVEGGVEHRNGAPAALPGGPDGVADAEFESQLFGGFPGVLREPVVAGGDPGSDGFGGGFRVIVEEAAGGVGGGDAGGGGVAGVDEAELAGLVDGGRSGGGGELDAVVLAGAFDEDAELHGVVAHDLGEVVGPGVDEAGPVAGVGGGVVEAIEGVDLDGGDFAGELLAGGKDVGVVEAVGGAFALRAAGLVVGDVAFAVGVDGEVEFVEEGGGDGACQAEGRGAIRT